MSVKKTSQPRKDRSAIVRLVHDFGLLMIKGDFERYLDERSLFNRDVRENRLDKQVSLEDQYAMKFVPLLELLGIQPHGNHPHEYHFEEIERLQQIYAFLQALELTVDFSLKISDLHKRLKRKFEKNRQN